MPKLTTLAKTNKSISSQLLALLENCDKTWQNPILPFSHTNALTSSAYRGMNTLILALSAQQNNFTSTTWATYNQWHKLGCTVRKSERSTSIIFWQKYESQDPEDEQSSIIARSYNVFNSDQVDGYINTQHQSAPSSSISHEFITKFFLSTGIPIKFSLENPRYNIESDTIFTPPHTQFTTLQEYTATLAHEFIHSTSHPSRLNRLITPKITTQYRAFEELVAEIGAGFLCSHLGITDYQLSANSLAYMKSWIKILLITPNLISKACSMAQSAADYIIESAAIKV